MTMRSNLLRGAADRSDALLHFIPLLREALAMPEDDPQKHEDDHVKDVKRRTETQDQDGR